MAHRRLASPIGQRVVDVVGHQHRTHRHVAGRQAFGHRDEVGHDAFFLAGEVRTRAAEGGDDLVGHEQDVSSPCRRCAWP